MFNRILENVFNNILFDGMYELFAIRTFGFEFYQNLKLPAKFEVYYSFNILDARGVLQRGQTEGQQQY